MQCSIVQDMDPENKFRNKQLNINGMRQMHRNAIHHALLLLQHCIYYYYVTTHYLIMRC